MGHIKNTLLGRGSLVTRVVLAVLVPSLSLLASTAGAQLQLPGVPSSTTVDDFITDVICVVAAYMFWILVAMSVVFVLVAAYKYVFSGGDPSKVSSATKTITFAAVSIAVALVAKAMPFIVGSIILGGVNTAYTSGPQCP